MRTIIDLPPELIEGLAVIAEKEQKSRSALIREAVSEYLVQRKPAEMVDAFGLWAERDVDGLEYEDQIRAEWGEE